MSTGALHPELVMGLDPGKVNFAWAIYSPKGLLYHGHLEGAEVITDLTGFRQRLRRKLDMFLPGAVFSERFQLRNSSGAIVNMELVNLMNGVVLCSSEDRGMRCEIVPAATHKAWTSRHYVVEKRKVTKGKSKKVTEKYDLGTYKEWRGITDDHEIDACNLAKFGYHKLFKQGEP